MSADPVRARNIFGVELDESGTAARPDWCGGAVIRRFLGGEDDRIACKGSVEPGYGLCSRCSTLERENRADLKDQAKTRQKEKRGEERTERRGKW